jgi:hypothetical protein
MALAGTYARKLQLHAVLAQFMQGKSYTWPGLLNSLTVLSPLARLVSLMMRLVSLHKSPPAPMACAGQFLTSKHGFIQALLPGAGCLGLFHCIRAARRCSASVRVRL